MAKIFSDIQDKRCWAYKTANTLASYPNGIQLKVNYEIQEIYLAESFNAANKLLDVFW
ncbi:MAG: hypothetical protein ACTS78_02665 [Arsenophonus sp. NC-WZS1-MAG3]